MLRCRNTIARYWYIKKRTTTTNPTPMKYKVLLQKTEEGYSVSCPELPGCWSQGETDQEALQNIREAIQEYLAVIEEMIQAQGGYIREVDIAA